MTSTVNAGTTRNTSSMPMDRLFPKAAGNAAQTEGQANVGQVSEGAALDIGTVQGKDIVDTSANIKKMLDGIKQYIDTQVHRLEDTIQASKETVVQEIAPATTDAAVEEPAVEEAAVEEAAIASEDTQSQVVDSVSEALDNIFGGDGEAAVSETAMVDSEVAAANDDNAPADVASENVETVAADLSLTPGGAEAAPAQPTHITSFFGPMGLGTSVRPVNPAVLGQQLWNLNNIDMGIIRLDISPLKQGMKPSLLTMPLKNIWNVASSLMNFQLGSGANGVAGTELPMLSPRPMMQLLGTNMPNFLPSQQQATPRDNHVI